MSRRVELRRSRGELVSHPGWGAVHPNPNQLAWSPGLKV